MVALGFTSLGLKTKSKTNKYKNARYAIRYVSKKDLSKIIRELEKLRYTSYERRRPKHEPTDSYFYPARQLAKCMMRADALNSKNYPVRTEMTGTKKILISHVYSTEKIELKYFLVDENLSHICSIDKDESKGIISDQCSTEEYES